MHRRFAARVVTATAIILGAAFGPSGLAGAAKPTLPVGPTPNEPFSFDLPADLVCVGIPIHGEVDGSGFTIEHRLNGEVIFSTGRLGYVTFANADTGTSIRVGVQGARRSTDDPSFPSGSGQSIVLLFAGDPGGPALELWTGRYSATTGEFTGHKTDLCAALA